MKNPEFYKKFPLKIVFLSNLLAFLIYGLGVYILSGFGWGVVILYLFYCLLMEFNVLRRSCVNCWYYGKVCGFGKGKICPAFFKKGDPKKFADWEISFRDLIPDFLVFIFPFVGGVTLLIKDFCFCRLGALIILMFLSFAGNGFVRGSLICKHCQQREVGCPAEKMFSRKK